MYNTDVEVGQKYFYSLEESVCPNGYIDYGYELKLLISLFCTCTK
jgi:hypothetical protein